MLLVLDPVPGRASCGGINIGPDGCNEVDAGPAMSPDSRGS